MRDLILLALLLIAGAILLLQLYEKAGVVKAQDRCVYAKKNCHAQAEFVLETCLIVYGNSEAARHKCLNQAADYEDACRARAGC
jgi:hypothetical protein